MSLAAATEKATYFISDLHLDASRPRVTEAFKYFLDVTAQDARAIYILGDFVESWIGDDDSSRYHRHLKALLKATVSRGVDVYFLHGNRDFLIGTQFCQETGITLLEENTLIDLYGQQVLLLHGDSLCTHDTQYLSFRKKVRDPSWQRKVLRYPLVVRRLIAAYMRFRSRRANSSKAENIMDVAKEAVISTFEKYSVNTMIHGHTHRPDRHNYVLENRQCERIVLGDWHHFIWYLKADRGRLNLVKMPITRLPRG